MSDKHFEQSRGPVPIKVACVQSTDEQVLADLNLEHVSWKMTMFEMCQSYLETRKFLFPVIMILSNWDKICLYLHLRISLCNNQRKYSQINHEEKLSRNQNKGKACWESWHSWYVLYFSRFKWIVGLECDRKGQVPAGSERGQQPQHFTLHLLDFVSRNCLSQFTLSSLVFFLVFCFIFLCAHLNQIPTL